MNSISGSINKHPREAQWLVALTYDQLKQLIKQAIAQSGTLRVSPYAHNPN
ncbi:MAG: hypothetical protein AAF915_20255 [Cyanobacteria bacterium P01_D01_bin.50]